MMRVAELPSSGVKMMSLVIWGEYLSRTGVVPKSQPEGGPGAHVKCPCDIVQSAGQPFFRKVEVLNNPGQPAEGECRPG